MLQIGAALFYYKLRRTLLQIGVASLLQIGASVVTNWSSYYKLGQPLLQNREVIKNWGKGYYKLGQVLQIGSIITNCSVAPVMKDKFPIKRNPYILRQNSHFSRPRVKTVCYGIESTLNLGAKIWDLLPSNLKEICDLDELKSL